MISSETVVVATQGANSKTGECKGEPECGFFTREKNSGTRTRKDDETKNDYACVQYGRKKSGNSTKHRIWKKTRQAKGEVVYVFRATMKTKQRVIEEWGRS